MRNVLFPHVYSSVIMGEEYVTAEFVDFKVLFEKAMSEIRLLQPGLWRPRGGSTTPEDVPDREL